MEEKTKDYSKYLRPIVALILAVITILVILGVILRYFFGMSLIWGSELARLLLVWMTMLGAGVLSHDEDHLRVNSLFRLLPRKTKFYVSIVQKLLIIFLLYLIIISSPQLIASSHSHRSGALRLPFSYWRASLLVGSILMIFYEILRMLTYIKSYKSGKWEIEGK